MKKTLKKLTATLLALVLLSSMVSLSASAASIFDKIADVKLLGDATVTKREVDWYIDLIEKYGGFETEEDYYCSLDWFCCEVALTGGAVIVTDEYGWGMSDDGKRTVSAYAYIDVRDYTEALEKGDNTIPVYYEVYLYSSIDIELDCYEATGEAKLVDCYVKSITPVSGVPEKYEEIGTIESLLGAEDYDLEGAVFDIEYPDGSVERATVEAAYDEHGNEYRTLNGKEIYYYYDYDENGVIISYEDTECKIEVEYVPFPISEIVIDDFQADDDLEPVSVSYTVVLADETRQSFTYYFEQEPEVELLGVKGYVAETVADKPIFIGTTKSFEGDFPQTEYLTVVIMADAMCFETDFIEGETQPDNLLNRLIYNIKMFLARIFEFFYFFL